MSRPTRRTTPPSPNQDDKRARIVEAARVVLARDGVAGCTARAVADASPLTKSAIHYYFRDIDEIVDAAVAAHVAAMLAGLREQAHDDPEVRLRAVIDAYLATFAEKPHAAFLWFEYWIATGRRGSTGPTAALLDDVRDLLAGLLVDLPVDDPGAAAHLLLSWLQGTIVAQHTRPRSTDAVQTEVTTILRGLGP